MTDYVSGADALHDSLNFQHRVDRASKYEPYISPPNRLSEAGTIPDLNFRSAYFTQPSLRLEQNGVTRFDVVGGYDSGVCASNVGGNLAWEGTVDLRDQTEFDITYGNPHISAFYTIPWRDMLDIPGLQIALFSHPPYYKATTKHRGGSISLIVHLYRVGAGGGHGISVVIKLYSLNRYQGNRADGPRRYDPNNDRLHVTSHVSPDSKYFEVHPMSAHTTVSRYQEQLTDEFGDMFAIKFTQERLERLLDESSELTGKDMGLPRDWRLGMAATHVELSEGFLGGRDADSTARVISDISGVHVWR